MKFLKKQLKNGMTVVMEKRDIPVVSAAIVNTIGSGYEEAKIKGISHFIEHMVFTGTKTRSHEDISREIEKKGGILNAFTSNEVTAFWFKLPSNHLFSGLDILSDMLKNPLFDQKKFEKERKVILEEIKMYHDAPARDIYDKIFRNLYGEPFGIPTIGSKETLNAMKRDFVFNYYKEHYHSGDYFVIIVGNANFEKVCEYFEKNFIINPKKAKIKEAKKRNMESVEEREGLDQAHFIFAMHAPLMIDKEYPALEVLDAYLASGMSSRLFLEIREKRGLVYAIKSSIESERDYSHYSIYAGTRKDAIPEIKEIIIDEFVKVQKMSEKDLLEAKERLIGLRKVSSEESVNVMNELIFAELNGKSEDYYKYEETIRKVTLDEVKKLAAEMIKKYSTAAIVPK